MSDNYRRRESSGRFLLWESGGSFAPFDPDGGSLGTGSSEKTWYFNSAMEREHFVEVRELRKEITSLRGQLTFANLFIEEVKKRRERARAAYAKRRSR